MSFTLERFALVDGTLELSGRWPVAKRFRHVRLVVEGRRIAPISQTREPWTAVFPWASDEAPVDPCLEAGPDLLIELPAPDRVAVLAEGPPEGDPLAQEREALAREREALVAERESLRKELEALAADRAAFEKQRAAAEAAPAPASAAPAAAAHHPRPAAIQHALELPRQPGEPVRGQAPPAIRAIAIALCSGVVLALLIILSAIF